MRLRTAALVASLAAISSAAAQDASSLRLEIRPFAGMYVPTGAMADDFKSSSLFGVQPALEINHFFHVLGTFGWSDGRSKIGTFSQNQTTMWLADIGFEANGYNEFGDGWLFRPFVGAGGGARTYDYKQAGIDTKTCTAGYGALGTEFQKSVVALRFEGRGYVNCFKQPFTNEKRMRADMTFALGFAYHLF